MGRTLYDKLWDSHVVRAYDHGEALLYVDLHLIHEVTTPQAFAALAAAGRQVRRPDLTLALADHNVPTAGQALGVAGVEDAGSRRQLQTFETNVARFGVDYLPMGSPLNGIVHTVAPELGRTLPGSLVVCGDSHTSTHGAFGALAFGIGTSEVEHVLATQTIRSRKSRNMRVELTGRLGLGVTSKDVALALIARLGTGGATGCVVEFAGSVIAELSMEARMTLCNMAIEAGARSGMIAPDQVTYDYLRGRLHAPQGGRWSAALESWERLRSDPDAIYDLEARFDVSEVAPMVSWGTSPQQAIAIDARLPLAGDADIDRALAYMGLHPGEAIAGTPIDTVFIGSCTNGRIEDLRAAAAVTRGRQVQPGVRALVVPGSGQVRMQAQAEGLDAVFQDAGWNWREPGCSMCIGLNGDRLQPGERAASTSNRNFEGRQGPGGRTHLVSPAMAAAAAIAGRLVDVRTL